MDAIVPYLELMRLTNPAGSLLVYMSHSIGGFYALATGASLINWTDVIQKNLLLLIISTLLHATGCSWNDIVDLDLDSRVKRTKTRPIPRGAISLRSAYWFTFGECIIWLALLRTISISAVLWSLPLIPSTMLYPFMKRITYFPSVFLGPIISWGIFTGAVAFGSDPLSNTLPLLCLLVAESLNVIILDMIYTSQDVKDDEKAGILSMAVRFKGHSKCILSVLALLQLGSRIYAGVLARLSASYLVSCIVGALLHAWMIQDVDLSSPASCWYWFQLGTLIMGPICSFAMFAETLGKNN